MPRINFQIILNRVRLRWSVAGDYLSSQSSYALGSMDRATHSWTGQGLAAKSGGKVIWRLASAVAAGRSGTVSGIRIGSVDGVANVADDQERRAAILGRQSGDVAACLVEGACNEGGDLLGGGVGYGQEWFHSGRQSECRRKRGLIPTDFRKEASAPAQRLGVGGAPCLLDVACIDDAFKGPMLGRPATSQNRHHFKMV